MPEKPKQEDIKKLYRDLPISIISDWGVPQVKDALKEFELGQFRRASMMADAMMRDDRIGAVFDTRVLGVLGLPLTFEASGDGRRKNAVTQRLDGSWWEMAPEDALAELDRWGIMLGVALAELDWKIAPGEWLPRLKVWHPQYLEYRWHERAYYVYTEDGPVKIEPGNGKWVLYTPGGGERPWMGGLVRRLAIPWLVRQFAYRDWARYSEVHGSPILKGRVPVNATLEDKNRFLASLAELGSETAVLCPTGEKEEDPDFDLALLEATGNTWAGFDRLLAKCESSISISVLGQNLTTEVKGGSYAAASVHEKVLGIYIKADTQGLSTTLRQQMLEPWAEFNLGNRELAPWPKWNTEQPTDPKTSADTEKAKADALSAFQKVEQTIGLPIDYLALAERFNVPLRAGEEFKPVIQQPPTPDDHDHKHPPKPAKLAALSQGGEPAPGFLNGQAYADQVMAKGRAAAAKVMAEDLAQVLEVIEQAESFEAMTAELVKLYQGMDPAELAGVIQSAMVLAELGGRHAVQEDV